MRSSIRQRVRVLYEYRCGYCEVRESDAGGSLTMDHFRPRSLGGSDDIENLVYCCHACNEFKGDYWHEDVNRQLLHPLRENVGAHLTQNEEGGLLALTVRGGIQIKHLRLNRPELIANRLQRQIEESLNMENRQILELLETLRQDNEALREQIVIRDLSRNKEEK